MKLYEISAEHRELEKLADESDDMAQAVADTMESTEGDFNDKAISLIHVVNNMSGDVEAIKSEITRLTERKKSIESRQQSMRDYLLFNMQETGIKKISCPLFTITLKNGRDIVRIDDESKLSTDYLNIKTTMTPMKREILAALKKGESVDGASLATSKPSLLIK